MAISDLIRKAGKKIVDVTSDVLSAPARIAADNARVKANGQIAQIKMVRDMKNVPDKGNESDPLFRARASVSNMKTDALQAARKKASAAPANQGDFQTEYAKRMSGKATRF